MPTLYCPKRNDALRVANSGYVHALGVLLMLVTIGLLPATSAEELSLEIVIEDLLPENGGTGTDGIYIDGDGTCSDFGHDLSAAGDFNGDGIDDFIVGARQRFCAGTDGIGRAYVFYGKSTGFPPSFNARELLPEHGGDGSAGVVLRGVVIAGAAGSSVAGIGDFNDDGIDDIAIGAPSVPYDFTGYAGAAYVVFGSASGLGAQINLSSLLEENGGDGTKGFVVYGDRGGALASYGDQAGATVRKAGDVNGDGIADLLVSAPTAHLLVDGIDLVDAGQAYLLFGSATPYPPGFFWSDLEPENGGDGSQGVVFNGAGGTDRVGASLDSVGDFNGDGFDDIALGASGVNYDGTYGAAYIIYGSPNPWPAVVEPSSMLPSNGGDGSLGLVIEATNPIKGLGISIAGIGDFNNDSFSDLAIGATKEDAESESFFDGVAYVLFGGENHTSPVFNVANLLEANGGNGEQGFVIHRINDGDGLGGDIDGGGDVDGDGFSDLILGARKAIPNSGQTYVLYGNDNNDVAEFYLSSLLLENGATGESGLMIVSEWRGLFGQAVGIIGDVNNDGLMDFATGDTYNHEQDLHWVGSAAVFFGKPKVIILPDDDLDGISNESDNCVLVENVLQNDADGDGYGNVCDADFDNSCSVNFSDYLQITQQYLMTTEFFDLTSDGIVNLADISRFYELFLQPVGPSGLTNICE